ncbi:hypothetical protein MMC10_007472 [Thelotrema lepadinum]|nr:hypothetical protein [Thelotrema lepadinum]
MAATREQPPWRPPPAADPDALPPLKIYNSLTRTKTPFTPIKWKTKEVSWYACGPTVYDDAHLGHARNYVSTDILRRILLFFFKFKVRFVMNVTDIDDKIILRGRQQHLLADFIAKNADSRDAALGTSREALKAYLEKNLPLVASDTPPAQAGNIINSAYDDVLEGKSLDGSPPGDREAKIRMHIKTAVTASEAIKSTSIPLEDFFAQTQDILLPYLDSLHGHSINAEDHSIFTKLTKKYEARFMEDVRALNCLDPDDITRVTEYGPQIVDFVTRIEKHGFAYKTADGSVYFDSDAFGAMNPSYPRLEPWNKNDKGRQAEGEGALTQQTTKKSNADFALWKASRPGEPSWPSPWGNGRPGWHIECSAMASDRLGSQMDIHSGGIDLAFPHHDNELAQSEAYWSDATHNHQHQWVNYFIHMGHLSIAGSKMSKSLKNFTTIREALSRDGWSPRSLRVLFLQGNWKDGIEITDSLLREGTSWEEKINNFFIKANDILGVGNKVEVESSNSQLASALEKAKEETFEAFCDSFDTRRAMVCMSELVTAFNIMNRPSLDLVDVRSVAQWITFMVNMLGLNGSVSVDSTTIGWTGSSIAEAAKPFVYPLSRLRDELRRKARSSDGINVNELSLSNYEPPAGLAAEDANKPYADIFSKFKTSLQSLSSQDPATSKPPQNLSKAVLQLCDRLRDVDLWDQGIYLEDSLTENEAAVVRPLTREMLAARREREERDFAKQKAKEEREREAAAKAEKGKLSHLDMFRTNEYSAWDDEGLPLKDAEGQEITKSKTKKIRKDWERQKKLHETWLANQKT